MSVSLYQVTVPSHIHMLSSLSTILDKAIAYCEEKKIKPEVVVNYRLAADMAALPKQIQIATDTAKGAGARLTGATPPSYEDNEETFDELKERLAKTIDFLKSLDASAFAGAEDKQIELKLPSRTLEFTGLNYVNHFVNPNFYFHVTTAYAILRHAGVPLGKLDYLGGQL
ncbi:MAG: DUF1993 domain-containing protein [Pseudomonadales bacterium]|nr:DUF1993 domain-containing protein [Pseudomonadales bacterium]